MNRKFLLPGVFFLLGSLGHAADPAAAQAPVSTPASNLTTTPIPVPVPSANDYHTWPAYRSAHYPVVVYSQQKVAPTEILFRVEVAMRSFEEDYPGFHFNLKAPAEVVVAGDAEKLAPEVADANHVVVPLAIADKAIGRADQTDLNDVTGTILKDVLQADTNAVLPDWFYNFITVDRGDPMLPTGAKPVFALNPGGMIKLVQNGHFDDMTTLSKPVKSDDKALFDDDPEFAAWLSSAMYVRYALEVPEGASIRADLAALLVAAGDKATAPQAKAKLEELIHKLDAKGPAVRDYWANISAKSHVLDLHLEAISRLWSALAVYADQAGTRYATFGDLRAAVEQKKIVLPPNVPPSLIAQARMFLDRDGAYMLTWDGKDAVLREVAREGFGFMVHAAPRDGFVDETVNRFTATPEEMAKLPDPDTNPFHSDHYLLISDSTPDHASNILLQADAYNPRIVSELPWAQPKSKARLIMYYYPDAWTSGLFDVNYYQPTVGVTFVSPTGDDYMRHEMTHQVVDFSSKGRFAWWFNEGIAEYYGRHIFYAGDGFVGPVQLGDEVKNLQDYLTGNWTGQWGKLTLPKLVHLDPDAWSTYKHGVYTLSWSIVDFLINGDNGSHRELFDNYMKAVASGDGDAKVRDAAFDDAVVKLVPQWCAYWTAASRFSDEKSRKDAYVRLMFLAREEALRQGFTEAQNNLGIIPNLYHSGKLKPSALRANRVAPSELDSMARDWKWDNKWRVTGTGAATHLVCQFPGGLCVEVWRDPATKRLTSHVDLSGAALARDTTSTMPAPLKPTGLGMGSDMVSHTQATNLATKPNRPESISAVPAPPTVIPQVSPTAPPEKKTDSAPAPSRAVSEASLL